MGPKDYFEEVWNRADVLVALHAYVAKSATAVLDVDELLRAEWAIRVSALDLYVHELVAQNLLSTFQGSRAQSQTVNKLRLSADAVLRIQNSTTDAARNGAFDLEVRTQLGRSTFQYPDDIADGVRLISDVKLWNEVALHLGSTPASLSNDTRAIKQKLSAIISRRNKIVHEGDLQPGFPRTPWPISRADLDDVRDTIQRIVEAMDSVV